ncbi:MAG: hypothetical protein JWN17_1767 [Frankiales bacterium]|nr:hypothetical protein [Frankiales bacterium]
MSVPVPRTSLLALVPEQARAPGELSGRQRRALADAVLLHAAAAGDVDAWRQLVEHHVADVWAWSVEAVGEAAAVGVSEVVWLRLAQALPLAGVPSLVDWFRAAVAREVPSRQSTARRGSAVLALRLLPEGARVV